MYMDIKKVINQENCIIVSPRWCCFSGNWRSSEVDSLRSWTSDIQDLSTSFRKLLYCTCLFVFIVLFTKIVLHCAQFSRYIYFRGTYYGIVASSSDNSCFGLYTDLNFCTKLSYKGQILNSCSYSCVCWLLSLKCQACPVDSERFLLIGWGKMCVEIVGSVEQ
jgi:hypothetical protein